MTVSRIVNEFSEWSDTGWLKATGNGGQVIIETRSTAEAVQVCKDNPGSKLFRIFQRTEYESREQSIDGQDNLAVLNFRSRDEAISYMNELATLLAHPEDHYMDEETIRRLRVYKNQCLDYLKKKGVLHTMTTQWTRAYENGTDYIESLNGVEWNKAPLPLPWHRCRTQTRGRLGFDYVERCACGATRLSGHWIERNQTRKTRARKRKEDRLPRVQVACQECGSTYEAAKGSRMAAKKQCTDCWGAAFIKSNGKRY